MHRRHLLIVGAGPNQLPAIELARSLGHRVSAIDKNPHAVGQPLVSDFGAVSTREVESAVNFAISLNRTQPIDGVMTMASESAITVASIADKLGLPGVKVEAARRATHKGLRQSVFQEHGIPAPRFARAITPTEVLRACLKIGFPCVIKPVDGAGSRGVRKISIPRDIDDAIAEIRQVSSVPEMLVEEFLTGTEHSIEGLVIDGQIQWTGFSDRNYSRKEFVPPHFLEDGDSLPSILAPAQLDAAQRIASEAVRALGIDWGPVKGDIMIDESGPKILEMAARLSGDFFCDVTVPLHNGIELVPAVMGLSLGENIDRETLKPQFARGVALRGVWSPGGKVRGIHGLECVQRQPGVRVARIEVGWEKQMTPQLSSARDRLVAIVCDGKTRSEAVRRAERAVATIKLELGD